MFQTKKKKIARYLEDKRANGTLSPFDQLLSDYLSGELQEKLIGMQLTKIDIHIVAQIAALHNFLVRFMSNNRLGIFPKST